MTKPTQTTLAAAGAVKLRHMLGDGVFSINDHDDLLALCDYAQAQIEARARGGRTITDARRAANKRNASRPRSKRKPQCACGAMTIDRATKRGHICG